MRSMDSKCGMCKCIVNYKGALMLKIVVYFLLLALVSCQTFGQDESTEKENTENEYFSVHISVPNQIQKSDALPIRVELRNESGQTVEVITGEPVFYYVIRDRNGNQMNTVLRDYKGVVRRFAGNDVVIENYSYQFANSGTYHVSAIAEIILPSSEGNQIFKMETDRKQVEVIETIF